MKLGRLNDSIKFLILALAYFITGTLGIRLNAVSGFATLVWAPSGIALAAIFLWGIRLWPAILVGAFLVNFVAGAHWASAAMVGGGNTLEALVTFYLLRRVADFHPTFDRMRDAFSFLVFAVILSPLVSPLIGVFSLWLDGKILLGNMGHTAAVWWLGDAMGNLLIAPILLVLAARPSFKMSPQRILEASILGGMLLLLSALIFFEWVKLPTAIAPRPSFIFPLLLWAVLRFRQHGAVLASFAVYMVAVAGVTQSDGTVSADVFNSDLFNLQLFFFILGGTGLILAGIVAERESAAEERLALLGQLREAVRARDEFISVASHELRTPITSLLLQTDLLQSQLKSGDNMQALLATLPRTFNLTVMQLDRLARLVDDMMDVARSHIGSLTKVRERVELGQLVRGIVDQLDMRFNKISSEIRLEVEGDLWGYWDRFRIEQVVQNLLTNALKYGEGRPIEIRVRKANQGSLEFSIQDYGIGIQKENQIRIFERFERVAAGVSVSGLGLGLYIVNQIVKEHDGRIRLESELGKGATFTVTLPGSA